MTVTLVAAADEPGPRPEQPQTPPPPPRPIRPPIATPWWQTRYRIAEHRRGTNPIPRQRAGWCCDLARYGDVCDCGEPAAEARRAFRQPILLDLRRGAA